MADIKEVLAGVPMPAAGVSGSTIAAFTADQMRTFGEACARAALAGLDTQQTTQLPAPAAGEDERFGPQMDTPWPSAEQWAAFNMHAICVVMGFEDEFYKRCAWLGWSAKANAVARVAPQGDSNG